MVGSLAVQHYKQFSRDETLKHSQLRSRSTWKYEHRGQLLLSNTSM